MSINKKIKRVRLILSPSAIPILTWTTIQPLMHAMLFKNQESQFQYYFKDKTGICIGGDMRDNFQIFLKLAAKIVNVNIEAINQVDYVADASDLYFAEDSGYDFVCSSHVLEHLMNPVKAILEWKRVLKQNGVIYCGVPDKRFTFDHKRKRTGIDHIIKEYKKPISLEEQHAHIYEAMFNTDPSLVGWTKQDYRKWIQHVEADLKNRKGILLYNPHLHTFVKDDVSALFEICGLKVIFTSLIGDTIHTIAIKQS
jgi:predicted SAM-dependent methyltransferase